MSSDAPALIEQAVNRFLEEVPALKPLALIVDLELLGRGDVQPYTVSLGGEDGLKITKGVADHARIRLEIPRAIFNTLAEKGHIADWHDSFDKGDWKASGDSAMLRLLAQVIGKQEERNGLRKAR